MTNVHFIQWTKNERNEHKNEQMTFVQFVYFHETSDKTNILWHHQNEQIEQKCTKMIKFEQKWTLFEFVHFVVQWPKMTFFENIHFPQYPKNGIQNIVQNEYCSLVQNEQKWTYCWT